MATLEASYKTTSNECKKAIDDVDVETFNEKHRLRGGYCEKADTVGGKWHWNRGLGWLAYPSTPLHSTQLSTHFYSTQLL